MIRHQISGITGVDKDDFEEDNDKRKLDIVANQCNGKKDSGDMENELDEGLKSVLSEDGETFMGQDNKEHTGLDHYLEKLNNVYFFNKLWEIFGSGTTHLTQNQGPGPAQVNYPKKKFKKQRKTKKPTISTIGCRSSAPKST
jgi:hypothetical protein